MTRHPHSEGPEPGQERLSDEEIEAILAREAQLPPEGTPPPLVMVQREPGRGKFGKWIVWVLIGFIVLTAFSVVGRGP